MSTELDVRITMTFEQWIEAKVLADRRMKADDGHYYVTTLATRCQFCGRRRTQHGRCTAWLQTFLTHLDTILLNTNTEETVQ